MFSTFTGSSRRPRNVNMSGSTGNPFSNTSWSPSVASNATKTVSNAQADREKRQAERQRLKAAGQIQRTWRGHRTRRQLAEVRRSAFDKLYREGSTSHAIAERLPFAFNLLLAFFTVRRNDDLQRLHLFIQDCETIEVDQISPSESHPSRMTRFVQITVAALNQTARQAHNSLEPSFDLLKLVDRIKRVSPESISTSLDGYWSAMAQLCRLQNLDRDHTMIILQSLATLFNNTMSNSELDTRVYSALAFQYLTQKDLYVFETNIDSISSIVDVPKLAAAIFSGYYSQLAKSKTNDQLTWLLAHFVALGNAAPNARRELVYLEALHLQLSVLCSQLRLRDQAQSDPTTVEDAQPKVEPLEPYLSSQVYSLVNHDGISRLLQDLSEAVNRSSDRNRQGTSLLAGYISALIMCFPTQADDIRMRLFLTELPTPSGDVPTIKFLWQEMHHSSLFHKLVRESEKPVDVVRKFIQNISNSSSSTIEEREWRVALIFLELYTFVLRLSDDDDFFSAINPQLLESSQSPSRVRACSLSLDDLKTLTTFLKNIAFVLHYQMREICSATGWSPAPSRMGLGSKYRTTRADFDRRDPARAGAVITALDLESLRDMVTTAMKMLYERDSRKQFLPPGHWLMAGKLEGEEFITAVIAEDERQMLAEQEGSDSDSDAGLDLADIARPDVPHSFRRSERMRVMQVEARKQRRLEEMRPKLEILKHMPFIVPFETRVKIFRQFISLDQERLDIAAHGRWWGELIGGKHHANIRRNMLFEDAFEKFYTLGDGLKHPISITFVDQFGAPEAGIDGGGVTKEFLTSVTNEAFGQDDRDGLSMFVSSGKGLLYPNPMAIDRRREIMSQRGFSPSDPEVTKEISNILKRFEFLGRIIGKCLYEGILVDLVFAGFFVLQWPSSGSGDESSYKGSVNDLIDLDEELYNGLMRLKNYPGDVSELGFDFTISDQISCPEEPLKTVTRKLIPNGDKIPVTNDNRPLYISYIARHRLVRQAAAQTTAFLKGLRSIIKPTWLSMFNQSELQRLVGGDLTEIDVEDLRRNTVYGGLYVIGDDQQEHDTVKLFWKVVHKFTDEQKRDLLKYVSSTPRAPLLGFSQLQPKFSIRDSGSDESRLPSTSTCVNLLKLPLYRSERVMREKLLYAITSGAGFDLS